MPSGSSRNRRSGQANFIARIIDNRCTAGDRTHPGWASRRHSLRRDLVVPSIRITSTHRCEGTNGTAYGTGCACGPGRAGWTRRSSVALRSLRTRRARQTNQALRSLRTRRARRTNLALQSLRTCRARRTNLALQSLWTRRARRTNLALQSLWTRRTCQTNLALQSLRTRRTCQTSLALQSLRTRRTCQTNAVPADPQDLSDQPRLAVPADPQALRHPRGQWDLFHRSLRQDSNRYCQRATSSRHSRPHSRRGSLSHHP